MTTFYVVTPSYNQAIFIEQTLQSLLTQKQVKVVSLVQDGGSTDETVKVLKQFGKQISWVSHKDKGQSDALNKGLKKALNLSKNPQKDIFAYLNSDDYYLPNVLADVAAAFEAEPSKQWLVGECQIVDQDNQRIQQLVQVYKRLLRMALSENLLLITNPIPQPAVFMRMSAVKQVGAFTTELKYTMDYEYWLRLWDTYGAPIISSKTVAAFRIHTLSKGGSQFHQQFDEELTVAKQFTNSSLLLGLHQFSNLVIKTVYSMIK